MIQANELRIGNLIYWDIPEKLNVLHEVVGIRNGRPQTIPISLGNRIEEYSPIPLTEEILVKCGFEEVYKSPMHSTYWMERLSYYFWYEKGNQYADCKGLQVNCKHLHQLQNLYFALTGEELTIKI